MQWHADYMRYRESVTSDVSCVQVVFSSPGVYAAVDAGWDAVSDVLEG